MDYLIKDILSNLKDIASIESIWTKGVVHRGGPHYRLKGTLGPISIGEDECIILGKLIECFRPSHCFIIGNAFGISSVYISKMMERCGGKSVITLDSKSEGDGECCFKIAAQLRDRMVCRLLTNGIGWSPRDINKVAKNRYYDLIFIDGQHSHPQVTRDFIGVAPLIKNNSIICWHDFWLPGIPESVREAEKNNFYCLKVNSSCEMVFGCRSKSSFRKIKALFSNTEKPAKKLRPLAYLRVLQTSLAAIIR